MSTNERTTKTAEELLVSCRRCGGSGFSGQGSGYDDVCSECGGLRDVPARFYAEDVTNEQ